MKGSFLYLSVFALSLSGTALAQTNPTPATGTDKPAHSQKMESSNSKTMSSNATPSTAIQYENRASNLMGEDIKNAQDEEIGEIDDLIISRNDKVLYAVVSVGGFLGMGEKLVTVPYNDLMINRDGDDVEVVYNATKEQLSNLPEFNYNEGEKPWTSRLGDEWNKLKGNKDSGTETKPTPATTQ